MLWIIQLVINKAIYIALKYLTCKMLAMNKLFDLGFCGRFSYRG